MRVIRPILLLLLGAALGVAALLFLRERGVLFAAPSAPASSSGPTVGASAGDGSGASSGGTSDAVPARVVPSVTGDASGAAATGATSSGSGADGPPALPVATSAEAEVAPLRTADLAFPITGIVSERLVNVGDDVDAGAPLLRLDARDAQARLREAQAAVAAADGQIEVAQAAGTVARRQVDAAQAAVAQAQAQRDAAQAALRLTTGQPDATVAQARAQLAQAEAGVQQAQAGVAQAQAAVEQATAQLDQASAQRGQAIAARDSASLAVDRLTLTAPFAGRVIGVGAEVGEAVGAGAGPASGASGSNAAGGGGAVVTLADVSGWRVDTTNLTELQVVGVRPGSDVSVEVDALPGVVLPGTVERIADRSQLVRGDVTYVATVRLRPDGVPPEAWAALRPGMTAVVRDLVR